MDLGFIVTFASDAAMTPQISIMREGGSGTPVPDLSVEVDDLDAVYRRALAQGFEYHLRAVPRALGRAALLRPRSVRPAGQYPVARGQLFTLRLVIDV